MLFAMVVTTWSLIGSFVFIHLAQDSTIEAAKYGFTEKCTNNLVTGIWSELPSCIPRESIVELPLPDDTEVIEVIPSHVQVPRCSGVCHQGNLYHKCVPTDKGRDTTTFNVMFRKTDFTLECSSVTVETHNRCKCGCDVYSASCTDKQEYDHHFCKCRCKNLADRSKCLEDKKRKFWDEATCSCVCRVEEYKECSTGFIYDPVETCECVREPIMNTAGTAVVAGFLVFILLLIVVVVWLAWKLKQSHRLRARASEETPMSMRPTGAAASTTSPNSVPAWPEPGPEPKPDPDPDPEKEPLKSTK